MSSGDGVDDSYLVIRNQCKGMGVVPGPIIQELQSSSTYPPPRVHRHLSDSLGSIT